MPVSAIKPSTLFWKICQSEFLLLNLRILYLLGKIWLMTALLVHWILMHSDTGKIVLKCIGLIYKGKLNFWFIITQRPGLVNRGLFW